MIPNTIYLQNKEMQFPEKQFVVYYSGGMGMIQLQYIDGKIS